MNCIETFKSALQCLRSNKMRSFLTMLGIIIGISSVIAMSAIGKGGQKKITGSLTKSGFGVYKLSTDSQAENYRSAYAFTQKDVDLIRENGTDAASPFIEEKAYFKTQSKRDLRGLVYSTDSDYERIDEVKYLYGRRILRSEFERREPVIVLDNITARKIFGDSPPLGKTIFLEFLSMEGIKNFTVVGVFEHPEAGLDKAGLTRFMPAYARISVPLMEKIRGNDEYKSLLVRPGNPEKAKAMLNEVIALLEEKTAPDIYDYEERVGSGRSFNQILSTLNVFVTFVASISLFVGGIGVMNIMLVSVTERIKEIGIRKAIGAKNRDILFQFITEAVVLSLSGGALGIGLGYTTAEVIGGLVSIEPIFSPSIVIISVVISMLIGIVFGVYPARQASLMNPIDALRAE